MKLSMNSSVENRKALVNRTAESSVAMTVGLSSGLYISHVFIPPTPGPIAAASTLGIGDNLLMVMGFGALCSIFPLISGFLLMVSSVVAWRDR